MRNCFEILGIEPTDEVKKIKRAYAAKSKECHPEEHPEEFKELHDAYERALVWAKRPKEAVPDAAEAVAAVVKTADSDAGAPEGAGKPADEWREDFEKLHWASEEKVSQSGEISRIIELCVHLYRNEKERNKLYHWKDILEEEEYAEVLRSRSFVPAWYEFLEKHSMFEASVWKYFASQDGVRFSGEAGGIPRLEYHIYIEEALKREERRRLEEEQTADGGGNSGGSYTGGRHTGRFGRFFRILQNCCFAWAKSERPMIGRAALYFLTLICSAFVCAVAGMFFGLVFG